MKEWQASCPSGGATSPAVELSVAGRRATGGAGGGRRTGEFRRVLKALDVITAAASAKT